MSRRVLVCGDRNWDDGRYLIKTLDTLHLAEAFTCVIDGEAPGADWMAGDHPPGQTVRGRYHRDPGWAWVRRVPGQHYPPDWNRYGRAAGPIRNRQMLVEGKPDLVIAFHADIGHSRGTRDMVRQARKAGLDVVLYDGAAQGLYNPDV